MAKMTMNLTVALINKASRKPVSAARRVGGAK